MLEVKISGNHRSFLVHKDWLFCLVFLTCKKGNFVPQGTIPRSCKIFSRSSQARSTPFSQVIGTLWQPAYVVLKVGLYSPFSQVPMNALRNL